MIEIRTTADLQPAITELIAELGSHGSEYKKIANGFEQFVSPHACWTTSTEYLTELRKATRNAMSKILEENEFVNQMRHILQLIDDTIA